jgi:hypothetical protein
VGPSGLVEDEAARGAMAGALAALTSYAASSSR